MSFDVDALEKELEAYHVLWDGSPRPHRSKELATLVYNFLCRIQAEPVNPWKAAVIDALVVSWTYLKAHETNPRKALHDLLAWETDVALDPRVSAAARKLQLDSTITELEALAAWVRTPLNINPDDAVDEIARVLENRARVLRRTL